MQGLRTLSGRQALHDLELDLHPLRPDGADGDGDPVPRGQALPELGQAREVGRQLHKDPVIPYRADHAGHGVPRGEAAGVLQPGAKELLAAQGKAGDAGISLRQDHRYPLTYPQPFPRVRSPGDGEVFQRQHGDDAAADVTEGPEGGKMRHPGPEDAAGAKGEKVALGFLLKAAAGEADHRRAPFVCPDGHYPEGDGFSHQGKEGNVPSRPADPGGDGLLRRQQGLAVGQGQVQCAPGIAAENGGLQHAAVIQRGTEGAEIRRPGGAQALRQVEAVIRHTIIPSAAWGGVDLEGILS